MSTRRLPRPHPDRNQEIKMTMTGSERARGEGWSRACLERLSRGKESNGHLCLLRAGKARCVHGVEQAFMPSTGWKDTMRSRGGAGIYACGQGSAKLSASAAEVISAANPPWQPYRKDLRAPRPICAARTC